MSSGAARPSSPGQIQLMRRRVARRLDAEIGGRRPADLGEACVSWGPGPFLEAMARLKEAAVTYDLPGRHHRSGRGATISL